MLNLIPARRERALVVAVLLILGTVGARGVLAAEEGFTPLFNGTSLDGWEGNPAIWSVQDGAIIGQTTPDLRLSHNTFLVWKGGTVDDFELRLSYRIVHGNSGIQYRSKVLEPGPQGPIIAGYQADMEAGTTYSGILYEERGRGILAQRGQMTRVLPGSGDKPEIEVLGAMGASTEIQAGIKSEDWNEYVVIARGNRFTHIINGRVTADVTDDDTAHAVGSGVLALQIHAGPPMSVQFKNIRIHRFGAATTAGNDLDGFQGDWVAVRGRVNGNDMSDEQLQAVHLRFKGAHYEVEWNNGSDSGSVKLLGRGAPKPMDIESGGGQTLAGIYELNGNRLRVAYGIDGAARPTDFEANDGSDSISVTYQKK